MEFKIEKGIPFGEVTKARYPFDKMEVGDSFKYPKKLAGKISSISWYYGSKTGMKFKTKNNHITGRIWRVK